MMWGHRKTRQVPQSIKRRHPKSQKPQKMTAPRNEVGVEHAKHRVKQQIAQLLRECDAEVQDAIFIFTMDHVTAKDTTDVEILNKKVTYICNTYQKKVQLYRDFHALLNKPENDLHWHYELDPAECAQFIAECAQFIMAQYPNIDNPEQLLQLGKDHIEHMTENGGTAALNKKTEAFLTEQRKLESKITTLLSKYNGNPADYTSDNTFLDENILLPEQERPILQEMVILVDFWDYITPNNAINKTSLPSTAETERCQKILAKTLKEPACQYSLTLANVSADQMQDAISSNQKLLNSMQNKTDLEIEREFETLVCDTADELAIQELEDHKKECVQILTLSFQQQMNKQASSKHDQSSCENFAKQLVQQLEIDKTRGGSSMLRELLIQKRQNHDEFKKNTTTNSRIATHAICIIHGTR